MSGICGIVRLDGGKVRPADVAAMTGVLERRGPDGTRAWTGESAALGHTLLATTPEALVEQLPLTDPDSGCTITADARLDNREELIADLGLENAGRVIGDGELILRAYLRWDEDCPKHLLGDFAFAIWDARSQQLFCARDHMGMRQFNYCHVHGQAFVFSTEDTGVLEHPAVPRTLDEGRIVDFIADREDFDFGSTFFEHVRRLPPAHSLAVNPRTCALRCYWTLEPGPTLQLQTDSAYADAFLAVFTEAVRARLRTSGKVASMLSGGLDSSAVTAVAAGLLSASGQGPLNTISAVGPDPAQCAETQAIQSALSINGLKPIFVSLDDLDRMKEPLIAELQDSRNPTELHGTMLRCIYAAARDNGIKVVLDGGSGDVILTSHNRVASLISAGKFKSALREVTGQLAFWSPRWRARFAAGKFLSGAWVAFAPLPLRSWIRQLRAPSRLPGAAPAFRKRVGFAARRRIAARHLRVLGVSDPAWRTQVIFHPNSPAGRERYDQLAASYGVESRDPFMDIRVIAFCLSLPAEQLEDRGWPKIILRRALSNLAPGDIAWRRGKEHLGWTFTTALLAHWSGWQDRLAEPHPLLEPYLSARALRRLRDPPGPPTDAKLRFFALDRFLKRYGRQPRANWRS